MIEVGPELGRAAAGGVLREGMGGGPAGRASGWPGTGRASPWRGPARFSGGWSRAALRGGAELGDAPDRLLGDGRALRAVDAGGLARGVGVAGCPAHGAAAAQRAAARVVIRVHPARMVFAVLRGVPATAIGGN